MRFLVVLVALFSSILNAQQTASSASYSKIDPKTVSSSEILDRDQTSHSSALDDACFDNKIDLIKQWFETIADNEGTSALCKCIRSCDPDGYTPLMISSGHNYENTSLCSYLVETLESCQSKLSTCEDIRKQTANGRTALMLASLCGNFDIVQYLVTYIESVEGTKAAVEYIKLKDLIGADAISLSVYDAIKIYLQQYLETNDK